MTPTSYIEISESAIKTNIDFINRLIGDKVQYSAVVKGNAYGHGTEIYCPVAYKHGVRHFSVANAEEAVVLKKAVPQKDVTTLIMGFIDNSDLEWAIENEIEFYVFEPSRLEAALAAAKKVGKPALIHLEVETGMNRTGLERKQFKKALELIEKNGDCLELKGVCTHLAGAESITNYKRIRDQQKKFKRSLDLLKKYDLDKYHIHMASSAATIRYPKTRFDLVRVGILQYGFFPTEETLVHYLNKEKNFDNPLKRVVSWKTQVMEIKTVKPGEFVGYGTSYFANKATRIAIIPVGYSSGFNRSLSNAGKVLIRGSRLDVIGTVNMNMMAVDITSCLEVEKGDEVVLIGCQGDLEISVSSFGDFSQTINYELLTRLPQSIPRITTK